MPNDELATALERADALWWEIADAVEDAAEGRRPPHAQYPVIAAALLTARIRDLEWVCKGPDDIGDLLEQVSDRLAKLRRALVDVDGRYRRATILTAEIAGAQAMMDHMIALEFTPRSLDFPHAYIAERQEKLKEARNG